MNKLFNAPTINQLMKIATLLNEELKDIKKDNITITFEVSDDLLSQIDEDLYIKNTKDGELKDFVKSDEVVINISGFKFMYVKKNEEQS